MCTSFRKATEPGRGKRELLDWGWGGGGVGVWEVIYDDFLSFKQCKLSVLTDVHVHVQ